MNWNLQNRTAIITGGSAGIGLACAQALSRKGVKVLIAAREQKRLDQAVAKLECGTNAEAPHQVLAVSADIAQVQHIDRVIQHAMQTWGRIDILINNAGSAPGGDFYTLSDQAYLGAWELKLLGYIRMVRAVAPYMKAQSNGRIINIVGAAAHNPTPGFLAGSTANAAILNFTKGMASELAAHNVRINAISPGPVNTQRAQQLLAQAAEIQNISVEEAEQKRNRGIPLGRVAEADEIADMALFLVSDRAATITGAEVLIDGGVTARV